MLPCWSAAAVRALLTSVKSAASTPSTRSAKNRSTWSAMTSLSARIISHCAEKAHSLASARIWASATCGSMSPSAEVPNAPVSNVSRDSANR